MSARWATRSPRAAATGGVADRLITEWKQKFGSGRRCEPVVLWQGRDVKVLGLALEKSEFSDLRTIAEALVC